MRLLTALALVAVAASAALGQTQEALLAHDPLPAYEVVAPGRSVDGAHYVADFHWRTVRVQLDSSLLRLAPTVHGVVLGLPPAAALGDDALALDRAVREVWLFNANRRPDSGAVTVGDSSLAAWFSLHPPVSISRIHGPDAFLKPEWSHFGQEYSVHVWSESDAESLVAVLEPLQGVDYAHRQVSPCSYFVADGPMVGCYASRRRARSLVRRRSLEPME